MAFVAETFTFDNVSSERYGLKITSKNSKDTVNIVNYKSDVIKTNRQSKFYPLRQTIEKPLEIPISIYSEKPLTRQDIDSVDSWLFKPDGKFRKLVINQDDMQGYYYNCRLISLDGDVYANNIYVVNAVMQCDSCYAWQSPQTKTYNITTTPFEFKFVNISSENTLKPTYTLTCNSSLGTIKITDITTNSVMKLNDLLENETLIIDTEREIITSDKRTSGLLDLFNKNFMRLERGLHNFKLEGNISEFKITYQNAKKFGN